MMQLVALVEHTLSQENCRFRGPSKCGKLVSRKNLGSNIRFYIASAQKPELSAAFQSWTGCLAGYIRLYRQNIHRLVTLQSSQAFQTPWLPREIIKRASVTGLSADVYPWNDVLLSGHQLCAALRHHRHVLRSERVYSIASWADFHTSSGFA